MHIEDIMGQEGWFFLQPYSKGDCYLTCGHMEAFRRRYGGPVTVMVRESHIDIAMMFSQHIDRIVTVLDSEAMEMARYAARAVVPGALVVAHPLHLYNGQADRWTPVAGFSDKRMYASILGLPLDAPLSTPTLRPEAYDEAVALASELNIEKGRAVILLPDANGYPMIDGAFWNDLSLRLDTVGWRVFTNLYGNDKQKRLVPFPGSVGIDPPLDVLLCLAEIAGWAISTLTGTLAIMFMAQIQCKKTVVAWGPKRGEELRFNDNFSLRSAYPFASQRKCDGFDYAAQEIEITGPEDYEKAIKDITGGHYALFDSDVPSPLPMVPLFIPSSVGELLDRISVLQIKSERISDRAALQDVKRELLHLESIVAQQAWGDTAISIISQLKEENELGWEGINEVYLDLDSVVSDYDSDAAIELCKIYKTLRDSNKRRIALKQKANEVFGSMFSERKTY